MTPRERLAAHLLNLYWTGAGDAGEESAIINFRDVIEETNHPLGDALENGKSTRLYRTNGYTVTMTDHFLMLADKIIEDLEKNTK